MANGTFEDLMAILETVPGNKEERTSLKVVLANEIYRTRRALGLTQSDLVKMINKNGETINQATISKIESAENDIKINTYEKVIEALGITVTVTGSSQREEDEVKILLDEHFQQKMKKHRRRRKQESEVKVLGRERLARIRKDGGVAIRQTARRTKITVEPYSHRGVEKSYKGNYEKELTELDSSK